MGAKPLRKHCAPRRCCEIYYGRARGGGDVHASEETKAHAHTKKHTHYTYAHANEFCTYSHIPRFPWQLRILCLVMLIMHELLKM